MKTYVLASKNAHKAQEIKAILGDGFQILTQVDAGVGDVDVIEDGSTFEENAAKKAETIMKLTGKPTIADDSGLCVDYLDGAPGVYTARYAGENAADEENIQKLLTALSGVPCHKRTAQFVCVIALAVPGEPTRLFRGECPGRITEAPKGEDGFGYDPVFYYEKYAMTLAEMEPHIKNAISHRSAALRKMATGLGE
ncbi:MAG: XTP/dITP diphosphatase [Clostridia bacterium]|nr:XTP/dITP diphosphatase [Clostridia bacterium]